MDDHRFDNLARSVSAAAASRRSALRLLGGGALGGLLALLGLADAEAGKKKRRKRPNRRAQRRCPAGTLRCGGGACVALQADPHNCGACGNACQVDEVCSRGACKTACDVGLTVCRRGACADLTTDPLDCGRCGNACGNDAGDAPKICTGGRCLVGQGNCPAALPSPGITYCNGNSGCFCADTTEGQVRCLGSLDGIGFCSTSAECEALGPGKVCDDRTGRCGDPCPS